MEKKFSILTVVALIALIGFMSYVSFNQFTELKNSNVASVISSQTKKTESIAHLTKEHMKIDLLKGILLASTTNPIAKESNYVKLAAAKERKVLMSQLAEINPQLFLGKVISKKERSKLPIEVQAEIEEEITISGNLHVIHIDDFKNQSNSKFKYKLQAGGVEYDLLQVGTTEPMVSNTKVTVKGFKIDKKIVVHGGKKGIKIDSKVPKPESVGPQETLVILVEVGNDRPFTKEALSEKLFNGPFQNFFKEQSHGKVSFKGMVTDWIKIPNDGNGWACGVGSVFSTQEIQNYILKNSINLSKYGRVLYMVSGLGGGGCSGVGKYDRIINGKTISISESWVGTGEYGVGERPFMWDGLDYVTSHEIGHALGVMHANAWDCDNESMYGNCRHIEYGNQFDAMGNGGLGLHFNAFYKEYLGWFTSNAGLTISQSGTYSISSLQSASSTRYAKIKNAALTNFNSNEIPFYLEYRQSKGFDQLPNQTDPGTTDFKGLFVNHVVLDSLPHTRLIDISPTSLDVWYDSKDPLVTMSNTFSDPGRGIVVGPVRSMTDESITFDVTIGTPSCVRNAPSIQQNYGSDEVAAGDYGYVGFSFSNNDYPGCGSSNFTVTVDAPAGWEIENQNDTAGIKAGDVSWSYIGFKVPENAPLQTETIQLKITNVSSGQFTTLVRDVFVIPKPFIDSLVPSEGLMNTNITAVGNNFSPSSTIIVCSTSGKGGCAFIDDVSSTEGTTLNFNFPSLIEVYDEVKGVSYVPPQPGMYSVNVLTKASYSNSAYFNLIGPATTTPTF